MYDRSSPWSAFPASEGTALRERVSFQLHHEIVRCELMPGEIVTATSLADRYKVKKAPVHAALLGEERSGLICALPRHGWQIAPITPRTITNVFTVRRELEPVLATADLSRIDIEQFYANIRITASLESTPDEKRFHLRWEIERKLLADLLRAFNNDIIFSIMTNLWDMSERLFNFAMISGHSGHLPYQLGSRDRLYGSLKTGETEAARIYLANEVERQLQYMNNVVMDMTSELSPSKPNREQPRQNRNNRPADSNAYRGEQSDRDF